MRHSVHIMFGSVSEQTLLNLKKYILKYGGEDAPSYFTALHVGYEGKDYVIEEAVANSVGVSQISFADSFDVHYEERTRIPKNNSDALKSYLVGLKRNLINADKPGDFAELHYCMYVPLFLDEMWKHAQAFIDVIRTDVYPIPHVDLIGFCAEMAEVFIKDADYDTAVKCTSSILKDLCNYNRNYKSAIQHIIAIDNKQSSGVSLKLTQSTLISIIGEFALLSIEKYSALFDGLRDEKELCSLGISTMSIDQFYFVEYLLRRTYLYALDREKVAVDEVDYNKMSQISDSILSKWIHLMSIFYKKEVQPRRQLRKDDQTIIVEILPLLEEQFGQFVKEIEDYLRSDELSIPEKKAFLAVLQGFDDASLVNDVFNEEQLIINDLEREAIGIFIDSNNALLNRDETKEGALLSLFMKTTGDELEEVFYPLDEIKKNRIKIKHCVATIREMQKNEEKLRNQLANHAESEKCLIENGKIVFKGQSFKLLPTVLDTPLQESYSPHSVSALSIDLRNNFTEIRNQGEIGSCLSHALTSVYEYFLKCNGLKSPDLSELFLYYNARALAGNAMEDCGSNLQASMKSLADYGICSEENWPYKTELLSVRPSDAAYNDAATRKVKVSLNVDLAEKDIKSALEDGFPVVVSVKVFESFTTGQGGFIPIPSENEKQSEQHGHHAMVICGYSDEAKVFIVRNSWGYDFGDAGYCYMPYSYITNSALTDWAAIIKEIVTAKEVQVNGTPEVKEDNVFSIKVEKREYVNFDRSDANTMLMVTQAGLVEQRTLLEHLLADDKALQAYYAKLKQQISDKNLQNRLREATIDRYNLTIGEVKERKQKKEDEKSRELDKFDSTTRKKLITWFLILVAVTLVGYLLNKFIKGFYKESVKGTLTEVSSSGTRNPVPDATISIPTLDKKVITDASGKFVFSGIQPEEFDRMEISLKGNESLPLSVSLKKAENPYSLELKKNGGDKYAISYVADDNKPKTDKKEPPKIMAYTLILDIVLLLVFALAYYFRLRQRKQLEQDFNDSIERLGVEINNLEKERDTAKVRFYISGFILSKLFELGDQLSERYSIMRSFHNNLVTWHEQLLKEGTNTDRGSHPTSVMLLSPQVLDSYFESNKEQITEGLKLSDFLKNFQLSEDGILKFKISLEKAVIDKITTALDGFSIYRYFAKEQEYPYLPPIINSHLINSKLDELGRKASLFQQFKTTSGAINPLGSIFIHLEDSELNKWNSIYPSSFSIRPNTCIIESGTKIALTYLAQMDLKDLLFYSEK